ncbi:MAG: GNAT family N-acetyltransferase [Crocinitomicaceae bacterium]
MIREAKPGDEYAIIDLIKELAVYEKEPLSSVKNTPAQLAKDLFNDRICSAYVVQIKDKVVGYAIYYFSYSTWNGVCLYLEDLYVQPEHRDKRIGSTLFDAVVSKAKEMKVRRMDWQIIHWNEPALDFYRHKGATIDGDWLNGRLFFNDTE